MKKLSAFLGSVVLLSSVSVVFAAKNETGAGAQVQIQQQVQQQLYASASPAANQIQNQNQVQTQNQGTDSQLQVNTREQENTGSIVSQKVQELLTAKTLTTGIGAQVKAIAQEQNLAQAEIKEDLEKINGRGKLLKTLIGPDYKALKNMQQQMEQNQLRLQQLEQLQTQLINQGDIAMVTATIQALNEQNIALQDKINLEEKLGGLFGWLFKLLLK